jgi:hypothetical protein
MILPTTNDIAGRPPSGRCPLQRPGVRRSHSPSRPARRFAGLQTVTRGHPTTVWISRPLFRPCGGPMTKIRGLLSLINPVGSLIVRRLMRIAKRVARPRCRTQANGRLANVVDRFLRCSPALLSPTQIAGLNGAATLRDSLHLCERLTTAAARREISAALRETDNRLCGSARDRCVSARG